MSDFLQHEIISFLIISGAAIFFLGGADVIRRLTTTPCEWTRKFSHVGCGLVVLSFPWMFESHWTVLAAATAFTVLMVGTYKLGLLEGVHGVGRGIGGVGIYPTTAYVLYVLDRSILDDPKSYFAAAILVLAFADAVAALVGKRIGTHKYEIRPDHSRSLEGSSAFFVVAFICTFSALLLGGIELPLAIASALTVASITALIEGVSMYGLDNILVPIAAILILHAVAGLPPERVWVTVSAAILVTLTGFAGLYRKPVHATPVSA